MLTTPFFVAGTDTNIGKTLVSAILLLGTKGCYWKPVQSGLEEETDTHCVQRLTGLSSDHFIEEAYRLTQPLSPHESARRDGIEIDVSRLLTLPHPPHSPLILEGAGGLHVPLTPNYLLIDAIKEWKLPVLLVARSGLGTINHTLLSIEALRKRSIPLLGVITSGDPVPHNHEAIASFGYTNIIGNIPTLSDVRPASLLSIYHTFTF